MTQQPVNIYCASCGAPARFDIDRQLYTCEYCGSETGIREPLAEKRGFRKLHRQNLEEARREYPLAAASCTGCGAEVVFPENEALTRCAFCGRALARREYLGVEGFPEVLIPFRLTAEEARGRLLDWCDRRRGREASSIRKHIGELAGCYLPYELVKGPVSCEVRRDDTARSYTCRGFLDGSFVNTSKQLNNLVLDGMEPFDLRDLQEFSFSFLAGQRVKMRDLNEDETAARVRDEIAADYAPTIRKTMETRAFHVSPDTSALVELGAVLPAYYLRAWDTVAAVNGQTGKVAVREIKTRRLLPWWLKPIFWTVLLVSILFGALYLFGVELIGCLFVAGIGTVFLLVVLFTAYHDKYGGDSRWTLPHRILTSDDTRPIVAPPDFYENVEGKTQRVRVRFTTPLRVLKLVALSLLIMGLPLILAFLLNGCSGTGLHVGGAAVWLCITVPLTPVLMLKYARLELYEHPLLWTQPEGGKWRRVRSSFRPKDFLRKLSIKTILIVGAVVLGLLILQIHLVLHWDGI